MPNPTPPPIFDADELRAKAEAPCNVGVAGIGDAFIHASLVGDYVAMPPLMLLALLDERAALLARVEAAEKFDPQRYSAAIPNLLIAAWDAGAAAALGECMSDGIEFEDDEVKALYAKNPHRPKREEA